METEKPQDGERPMCPWDAAWEQRLARVRRMLKPPAVPIAPHEAVIPETPAGACSVCGGKQLDGHAATICARCDELRWEGEVEARG